MYEIHERNEKSVNAIVSTVKLASLLFCLFIFYSDIPVNTGNNTGSAEVYLTLYPMGILSLGIILIYLIWSFSRANIIKNKNVKYRHMAENLIYIVIFSALIVFSRQNIPQYKILYLFIIMTATLQSGMRYGMTTAVISSAVILVIDLIWFSNGGFNRNFENDMIMAGVYILTAWPLGHYVKIEEENIKLKNLQLNTLNNELINQKDKRKNIEEILLKNEVCYNLIIENSKVAIFVHSSDKLIFANESAVNLLGYNYEDEISNKSLLDFVPLEEKEQTRKLFTQIYNEKKTMLKFEGNLINSNGDEVNVQNISNYFVYNNKAVIVSIVQDISSEKQVEQLKKDVEESIELLNETREFNNSITELFANISHELKTPLNVIFSALQVLSVYKVTDIGFEVKKDRYFSIMKQNCYRLMRLINNFLDITKLDAGFLKINLGNFDIVKTVEDITLSVASYVESKDISLIFDTDIEERIMAFDPDIIERIMLNLLSNAFKYSKLNGQILVSLINKTDEVNISVKDTGVGIPQDKTQLIFERFGQVDKTLRRVCEGTGIGLSLVKSFVDMHYGAIELKTEPDVGSEFIVILPARVLPNNPKQEDPKHENIIERINIEFSDIYSDNK